MDRDNKTKFIFVSGGVVSSLGKGLAAASLGALLEARGLHVTLLKMDPYINVDPGTMSPLQHGEVFVTDDGAETDLDLGHYERFRRDPDEPAQQLHHRPDLRHRDPEGAPRRLPRRDRAGHPAHHRRDQKAHPRGRRRFRSRDRRGRRHRRRYREPALPRGDPRVPLGLRTRQRALRPSDPGAVHPGRRRAEDQADPAQRQGADRPRASSPTSCSAAATARSTKRSRPRLRTSATSRRTASSRRATSNRFTKCRCAFTRKGSTSAWSRSSTSGPARPTSPSGGESSRPRRIPRPPSTSRWSASTSTWSIPTRACTRRSPTARSPTRRASRSTTSTPRNWKRAIPRRVSAQADAIIIPGGFGERGIEGKIRAVRYARENRVPILGICLGLQMMVIEFARDLLGLKRANSSEVAGRHARPRDRHHGDRRRGRPQKGGTMRLGSYPCSHPLGIARARALSPQRKSPSAIAIATKSTTTIAKRSRKPASSPPAPRPTINWSKSWNCKGHPWFLGCQFHPELTLAALGLPSAVPRAHPRGGRAARRDRAGALAKVRELRSAS